MGSSFRGGFSLRPNRGTDFIGRSDPLHLSYWMRQPGLADLLPSLRDAVYVGLSAGSMVMAPNVGEDFVHWKPPTGGDETLGLVGFSMFPHLDHEDLPENSMADAEKWAAGLSVRACAIDDQTAVSVRECPLSAPTCEFAPVSRDYLLGRFPWRSVSARQRASRPPGNRRGPGRPSRRLPLDAHG
jgi:Peptidase family S51